jgi:hypothetical protein
MAQHKLNQEGLERVRQARHNLRAMCGWTITYRGEAYWRDVDKELGKMLAHGTTDGTPYVEPQPEIPEGYRPATEEDKRLRKDLEVWNGKRWINCSKLIKDQETCCVPVDRIPTDEDALQRPAVMVRDNDYEQWRPKQKLIGVMPSTRYKFVTYDDVGAHVFAHARFPYPGELD